MAAQRQRDTGLEMAVRCELHARGLRFRLHRRIVPGAPRRMVDIVFSGPKVAVDCRGCWWHGCPEHHGSAVRNGAWWREKIASNRQRDTDTERRLADAGWFVLVAWEHDDPLEVADRVAAAVIARGCR